MPDYIFFMHHDASNSETTPTSEWSRYIEKLQETGVFQGGSSIGTGVCKNMSGSASQITTHVVGYIRVHAETLVEGNPVFEAGGTVEIRELLHD